MGVMELNTVAVAAAAGVTVRQLSYWVTKGWIPMRRDAGGPSGRFVYGIGAVRAAAFLRDAHPTLNGWGIDTAAATF